MPGLNRATLLGNVGKKPIIRKSKVGRVATVSLATTEKWTDRETGQPRERVEWHTIVVYDQKTVDFIERFVGSGSRIYAEGPLQTRGWKDGDKVQRLATEIIIDRFQGKLELVCGGKKKPAEIAEHAA